MRRHLVLLLLLVLCGSAAAAPPPAWKVPVAVKKLKNGLTVVVSEEHGSPTFGICISYGIGFRSEPKGRSGFAHLFEHMMFQGTPNAPKGTFDRVIELGGGNNNGFTRHDFTAYIEEAPTSALEPILWMEADRMKTLDFSVANLDNQRKVVKEEVLTNVRNTPYGLFFGLDLPQKAFDNYPNAHDFYGDFTDLDAASIEDVKRFFEQYYAPNNAVLALVGDVKAEEAFALVEKYFGAIPSRPVPARADVSEAPQKAERRFNQDDALAKTPAMAIGYRMPSRTSPDAVVAAIVGELLHNGQASRLYHTLVKDKQVALEVQGGVNWPFGNPFDYNGPVLMTSLIIHPSGVGGEAVLSAVDAVIEELATKGPSPAELDRIRTKVRSDWYSQLENPMSRAIVLANAVLFDGNTDRVNGLPDQLAKVTPAEIQQFVRTWMVKTNRTVIFRAPAAGPDAERKGGAK